MGWGRKNWVTTKNKFPGKNIPYTFLCDLPASLFHGRKSRRTESAMWVWNVHFHHPRLMATLCCSHPPYKTPCKPLYSASHVWGLYGVPLIIFLRLRWKAFGLNVSTMARLWRGSHNNCRRPIMYSVPLRWVTSSTSSCSTPSYWSSPSIHFTRYCGTSHLSYNAFWNSQQTWSHLAPAVVP